MDVKETNRRRGNKCVCRVSGTIFGNIAARLKIEPCSCEMKRIDPEGPTPDFSASAKCKSDAGVRARASYQLGRLSWPHARVE